MRKTKEILRLHFGMKLSIRKVAQSCNVSRSTVSDYIGRAAVAGIGWPLPEGLDDTALETTMFPSQPMQPKEKFMPLMQEMRKELGSKGVTLQLLWLEYKQNNPDGYQYSQFCELYRRWVNTLDLSLRQEHKAGEKMFVDFAGKGIAITNPATGETKDAEIFVAILGASNYTYAEAVERQYLPSWVGLHIHAFEFFGGVTDLTIPDNLKAAVIKACRYEPDLTPAYQAMAEHYGTVIIPARVKKPKDKSKVEAAVLLVTRWITAALRHHTFFSLRDLNDKIRELLESLNNRKFKKLNSSRRELYETLDKPSLKPLPSKRYEYADFKKVRAHIDYHIELEGHYYSVPSQLRKKELEAWFTAYKVEIFYKGNRIATHARSYEKGKFTTIPEHRPESHKQYYEWTPSRIINWAAQTGPETAALVEGILASRPHPEQGYRSCSGIMSLGKKFTPERLEAACTRAVGIKSYSYKSVQSILKAGLDKQPMPQHKEVTPIEHENIRGDRYYS
jgi:transposase